MLKLRTADRVVSVNCSGNSVYFKQAKCELRCAVNPLTPKNVLQGRSRRILGEGRKRGGKRLNATLQKAGGTLVLVVTGENPFLKKVIADDLGEGRELHDGLPDDLDLNIVKEHQKVERNEGVAELCAQSFSQPGEYLYAV